MKFRMGLLILAIASCLTLSGCWDQKIYEQIGFILEVGIEESKKEGEFLITYTSPVFDTQLKEKVEVIPTTSGIMRGARENARRLSARQLEGGKIQQVIFSEEVAKKGIHNILEILQRDPVNPALAWVVISEGSPREMFEKGLEFKDKPRVAIYINQLLEGTSKVSYIPQTKVYDFDINYYIPGLDPITPIIRLTPEDIQVVGTALFDGDRMVGKIDSRNTALLLAMKGMMKTTEYVASVPESIDDVKSEKNHIAIYIKDVKRKISVNIEDNRPVVDITLAFEANLDEYKWGSGAEEAESKILEKYIAKAIEEQCMRLMQYTQEVGSDPLGIGDMVRARHNKYWDSVDWREVYEDITFNVEAKVEIQQYGTIR